MTYNEVNYKLKLANDLQWPTMAYLNGLQSKRKTKEDQGQELGERKISIIINTQGQMTNCPL